MSTEAELQRQNERFELLLNLVTGITSSLDLREVFRAIAANIREVIHADAVGFCCPTQRQENQGYLPWILRTKGVAKEELFVTPSAAAKKPTDTLKPVIIDTGECDDLSYDVCLLRLSRNGC